MSVPGTPAFIQIRHRGGAPILEELNPRLFDWRSYMTLVEAVLSICFLCWFYSNLTKATETFRGVLATVLSTGHKPGSSGKMKP